MTENQWISYRLFYVLASRAIEKIVLLFINDIARWRSYTVTSKNDPCLYELGFGLFDYIMKKKNIGLSFELLQMDWIKRGAGTLPQSWKQNNRIYCFLSNTPRKNVTKMFINGVFHSHQKPIEINHNHKWIRTHGNIEWNDSFFLSLFAWHTHTQYLSWLQTVTKLNKIKTKWIRKTNRTEPNRSWQMKVKLFFASVTNIWCKYIYSTVAKYIMGNVV